MRSHNHTSGSSWATNLGIAPALPAPVPDPELTIGQRMVLLKLRRGELAAVILEKLAAMSVPEPAKSDWSAMIAANYIGRTFVKSAVGHLALTPSGHAKAHEIMRSAAVNYGVHLMQRSGNIRGKHGIGTRCSCGTYSRGPYFSFNGHMGAIERAEIEHLRAVEAGTWQLRASTDRLNEFLNEVAPPRLDLTSGPAISRTALAGGPDPDAVSSSVSQAASGISLD